MKILVDGDIIVYRCGFAAERSLYQVTTPMQEVHEFDYKKEVNAFIKEYGGNESEFDIVRHRVVEPLGYALQNVKTTLSSIMERLESEDMIIYLTGQGNFRDKIAKIRPYKGNRDPDHKPQYYEEIKRYLMENYHTYIVDGAEADDALAFEQNLFDTVIVSTDKDLDQVAGMHFNWVSDEKYYIEPEFGAELLWKQVLMGDTTDNIQGIPKIGIKKAEKILDGLDIGEMKDAVMEVYQDYYEAEGREYAIRHGMEPLDIMNENKNLVEIGSEIARQNISVHLPHTNVSSVTDNSNSVS